MSSLMQPRRRLDRRDIMRLVQLRKWNEFAQTRDDRRIDQDGGGKTLPPWTTRCPAAPK